MENPADQGVTAPPADNSAVVQDNPNGSEAVTNAGKSQEQTVPFTRFQEVNDKAKASDERASQLERELEELRDQQLSKPQNDDDIEPDTLDLIKKSAAKLGLVSKQDLEAQQTRFQVQQDLNDLTVHYKDSGVPFDGKKVIEYAKANDMALGSKKSLDAVYKEMNYEAIVESQRKAAVDAYLQGAKNGGEKPGGKGAQAPEQQKPGSLKDRIRMAREGAGVKI